MKTSEIVTRTNRFVLRVMGNQEEMIDVSEMIRTMAIVAEHIDIPPVLFATVVEGEQLEDENGAGFGCYFAGSIIVAGCPLSEQSLVETYGVNPEDYDPIRSFRQTLIHEVLHYKQDINGDSMDEELTDQMMHQVYSEIYG